MSYNSGTTPAECQGKRTRTRSRGHSQAANSFSETENDPAESFIAYSVADKEL